MAWIVFGTFFLVDGHAPWWLYPIWFSACVFDWVKDRKSIHVVVDGCACKRCP